MILESLRAQRCSRIYQYRPQDSSISDCRLQAGSLNAAAKFGTGHVSDILAAFTGLRAIVILYGVVGENVSKSCVPACHAA